MEDIIRIHFGGEIQVGHMQCEYVSSVSSVVIINEILGPEDPTPNMIL